MKMPFNSVAARIVLAVAVILAAAGVLIGMALYRDVRHAVNEDLRSQLNQRLAWLQASVELDDAGRLEFEAKPSFSVNPEHWRVSTADGKVLWESEWDMGTAAVVDLSRPGVLGDPNGKKLTGNNLETTGKQAGLAAYLTSEKGGRLDVVYSARDSSAHGQEELRRIALALWTIGPASLLVLVLVLGLFIRWQLAPLATMSREAAVIGPQNTDARIAPVGSAVELCRLREAINAMVARLSEGMERERQFSSMAAHELRTPLTQMRLGIEVALNKPRTAGEYEETLRQSLGDLERLQKLVANLLFLTRHADSAESAQPLPLDEILARAIRVSGSTAHINGAAKAVHVVGNAELLESAFKNVLENAAHYAPGAPPEVAVAQTEKGVRVSVTDAGPGVPAKDRERIFEPLTRLDAARTIDTDTRGFGLGLTVARCAVRACGGELSCEARPDGKPGAVFVFLLR